MSVKARIAVIGAAMTISLFVGAVGAGAATQYIPSGTSDTYGRFTGPVKVEATCFDTMGTGSGAFGSLSPYPTLEVDASAINGVMDPLLNVYGRAWYEKWRWTTTGWQYFGSTWVNSGSWQYLGTTKTIAAGRIGTARVDAGYTYVVHVEIDETTYSSTPQMVALGYFTANAGEYYKGLDSVPTPYCTTLR